MTKIIPHTSQKARNDPIIFPSGGHLPVQHFLHQIGDHQFCHGGNELDGHRQEDVSPVWVYVLLDLFQGCDLLCAAAPGVCSERNIYGYILPQINISVKLFAENKNEYIKENFILLSVATGI